MVWKRKETKEGVAKLSGPKDIPDLVGRHMVAQEKKDPDWVWKLNSVVRPANKQQAFYCRIFDAAQAGQAGVKVKDWTSLNGHPDLIAWEGYFDKETITARREKFIEPVPHSN